MSDNKDIDRIVHLFYHPKDLYKGYPYKDAVVEDMCERYGYNIDNHYMHDKVSTLRRTDNIYKPQVPYYMLNIYIVDSYDGRFDHRGIPLPGVHHLMTTSTPVKNAVDLFMVNIAYKPASMVDSINSHTIKSLESMFGDEK